MSDFLGRILLAGFLLLSVVAGVFDPNDLTLTPSTPSGRKFIKQNTRVPINCTAARNGNVSFASNMPNFNWTAKPILTFSEKGKMLSERLKTASGTIESFGPSDVGTYTCQASIDGKLVGEKSVKSEIYQGLNLSATQTTVLSHVGAEKAKLHCAVMPIIAQINITWLNANGTIILAGSPFAHYSFEILTILQVDRTDAGPYTCKVAQTIKNANDDGSDLIDVATVTINLLVEHVPEFEHPMVELQRNTTEPITLTCDAETGVPVGLKPPTFSWYRNGTNMSDKGDDTFLACRVRHCTVPFDEQHSPYDSIRCKVYNRLGMAEKTFRVVNGIDVPTGNLTAATPAPKAGRGALAVAVGLAVMVCARLFTVS